MRRRTVFVLTSLASLALTAAVVPQAMAATTAATAPAGVVVTVPAPVVRFVGVVRAGVEMGCMLLVPDGSAAQYLLIGGDRTIIQPGARLEVYGRLAPGTISFCMQGRALEVVSARPV